jgi:hypothetical protein
MLPPCSRAKTLADSNQITAPPTLQVAAVHANAGCFDFRDLIVVNATKEKNSCLRLVEGANNTSFGVDMNGWIKWANEDRIAPHRINQGGQEPVEFVTPPAASEWKSTCG